MFHVLLIGILKLYNWNDYLHFLFYIDIIHAHSLICRHWIVLLEMIYYKKLIRLGLK